MSDQGNDRFRKRLREMTDDQMEEMAYRCHDHLRDTSLPQVERLAWADLLSTFGDEWDHRRELEHATSLVVDEAERRLEARGWWAGPSRDDPNDDEPPDVVLIDPDQPDGDRGDVT